MELIAALKALESLKRPSHVHLYSDSTYLKKGISEWLVRWKKNHWQTADKKPVKNQDLWQKLDAVAQHHHVSWHWLKGHAQHTDNLRADKLARAACKRRKHAQAS